MSYYTEVRGRVTTSRPLQDELIESVFDCGFEEIQTNVYEIESEVNFFNCSGYRGTVHDIPHLVSGQLFCTTEEDTHYMLVYREDSHEWERIEGEIVYPTYTSIYHFLKYNPQAAEIAKDVLNHIK